MLDEGWYLMSVAELEKELARARDPSLPSTSAIRLTTDEALRHRNRGNVPDDAGRSLRLVLHVASAKDVRSLSQRRLDFEPDFHEAPTWRVDGSIPINVVPLRVGDVDPAPTEEWWNESDVSALESEWRREGTVSGVRIPGEYRSFVYKTVLSLKNAGREVTVDSICDSVARWLPEEEVAAMRRVLQEANR
jgi:hypothetical protein